MDYNSGSSNSSSPRRARSTEVVDTRELTKVLGTLSDLTESPLEELEQPQMFDEHLLVEPTAISSIAEQMESKYVDTGIQYSPQASPKKQSRVDLHELLSQPSFDIAANQRRKRTNPKDLEAGAIEELANGVDRALAEASVEVPHTPTMSTSSTQTDVQIDQAPAPQVQYVSLPTITIESPSATNSARTSMIQMVMANSGSQTIITSFVDMVSTGMQTDKIRVDLRGSTLPEHIKKLLNRADGSDVPKQADENVKASTSDTQASQDVPTISSVEDVPTIKSNWSSLRKGLLQNHAIQNDNENNVSAINRKEKRQRHGRSFFIPPTPVPEADNEDQSPEQLARTESSVRSSLDRSTYSYTIGARPFPARTSSLPAGSEKTFLKHYSSQDSLSSNASSSFSARSGPPPPFAIPKRRSSRQMNLDYASGTSTPSRRPQISPRKRGVSKRSPGKVGARRTGSAMTRRSTDYERSRPSSRPMTPQRRVTEQQPRPQLESNNSFFGHQRQESSQDVKDANRVSMIMSESAGIEAGDNVIDAIAATMVGEWMWKYVKGKNFGSDDFMQDPNKANAVRHKRWVWLSPYDNTVLWANKRPTSSAALMGKSDRKMVIQSVFDVKDSAALPKGAAAGEVFDHSIIIVTPTRALKFTATTKERHHLWLTALTYISKQTPYHDSINLDIPMAPRPFANQDDNSTLTSSKNSHSATLASAAANAGAINTQTRFPFPFDHRNFSCTTSVATSPARPVRVRPAVEGDFADAVLSNRNVSSNTAPPFAFTPAPGDAPDAEADWTDCALPPTVPRLPSGVSSSAASLRKKNSNLSLRPGSTRAASSIEISRTSSLRDGLRPNVLRAATTAPVATSYYSNSGASSLRNGLTSHPMPKFVSKRTHSNGKRSQQSQLQSQLAWPITPPRSSCSPDDEEDDDVDDEDAELAAVVDSYGTSTFDESEASFASNASFFDAVTMPSLPSFHGPPGPLRGKAPVVEAEDEAAFDTTPVKREFSGRMAGESTDSERRESVDSVAPPSFRTVRGLGVKRSGRVGRMLWGRE